MLAFMFIDEVFPQVVVEKSTLRERLLAEGVAEGWSEERARALLSVVPEPLIASGCFLDKMTGLWRYEFGVPYDIADKLVLGANVWVAVKSLFATLSSAYLRLPEDKRAIYLKRLADPVKHQETLVEMIPAHKVDPAVPMEFEVAGLGAGGHTIDWAIRPEADRSILLDVKRRITDFIQQAERIANEGVALDPDHDHALLFRSVEQKFVAVDPISQLQGAWVFTDIKQEEELLALAFGELDPEKVHFVILGDWKADIHVLARREEDRQYLLGLFRSEPSSRFTFSRANEG